jgi:NIMA (never in mitosis gene a)-related kinase
MPPTTLSDFELGARLGKGSFGEVFRARRLADGRTYVIKVIYIAELAPKAQRDAVNEVHVMASLDSPFVVRYFDSFIEAGSLHIVMEYCACGDLQRLVRGADDAAADGAAGSGAGAAGPPAPLPPIEEQRVWAVFLQVLQGLAYLHSRRILHRDLKSANIFLTPSGGIKIGDLGVARVLGTESFFAKTCVGTPYYLSPELCEDKPYNDKSDMWALGCVLYELCTRRHPFDARNQGALILKIIQGKFPPVSDAHYSAELRGLVDLLLARDTRRRPSAAEVLAIPHVAAQLRALAGGHASPEQLPRLIAQPPIICNSGDAAEGCANANGAAACGDAVTAGGLEDRAKSEHLHFVPEVFDTPLPPAALTDRYDASFPATEAPSSHEATFPTNARLSARHESELDWGTEQRPPSPLAAEAKAQEASWSAEADSNALAVYDRYLSTSTKRRLAQEQRGENDNESDERDSARRPQSPQIPVSSTAGPRRNKWFEAIGPSSAGVDASDNARPFPREQPDKMSTLDTLQSEGSMQDRRQQQQQQQQRPPVSPRSVPYFAAPPVPTRGRPQTVAATSDTPGNASRPPRSTSDCGGRPHDPHLHAAGLVPVGSSSSSTSAAAAVAGPRSSSAVGGSRRVRRGDPTGGVRPQRVLPLSTEAQRAASAAAAVAAAAGPSRGSARAISQAQHGPSTASPPSFVRVSSRAGSTSGAGASAMPSGPRSPQQIRRDQLARLAAEAEVAGLPEFPGSPPRGDLHALTGNSLRAQRAPASTFALSSSTSLDTDESQSSQLASLALTASTLDVARPAAPVASSGARRVQHSSARPSLDQLRAATALATEAAFVVQSSGVGATQDSSADEADVRWEVRDESGDEYTADFDELKEDDQANDGDGEEDDESAIVDLLYERSVLAEQARVLSAACDRDLAPTAAADSESDPAAGAPEASSSYILFYRLNFCKARLREV